MAEGKNDKEFELSGENLARLNLIQSVIRTDSAEHWLARLEKEQVPCAPVLTRTQVLAHPQVKANDLVCVMMSLFPRLSYALALLVTLRDSEGDRFTVGLRGDMADKPEETALFFIRNPDLVPYVCYNLLITPLLYRRCPAGSSRIFRACCGRRLRDG